MAGALIGALRVSLSAETSAFEAGMKRSQRTAKTTANSIVSDFKSAGGAMGALKAGVAGFVASLSVGTIIAAGKAALDYAASLGETADQLGVTTKELQNFRAVAMQNGASLEEADAALGKLSLNMSKAESGSKTAAAAFDSVGVKISDITTKSRWEIIGQISDKMNEQGGAARNAAAGQAIFGKGFQKLIPTLDQGSAGINALADANERLGGVLSGKEIQNADKTADKLEQLMLVLKTKIASDVAANSTAIGEFTTFLFDLVNAATQARQALADFTANYNLFNLGTSKAYGFGYAGKSVTTKLGEGGSADAAARKMGLKLMSDVPRTRAGAPPQFLAGGGGGGRKRGGGKDRSAEEALRKQLDALRDTNQFDQDIRRAKIDVLQATRDLATDAVQRYAISVQIKDAERAAYASQLQYDVKVNELTKGAEGISAAQAEQLLAQYDLKDSIERQKLIQDEQARAREESARVDMAVLENERDLLDAQLQNATTAKQRRDIQRRIIDLNYRMERAALNAVLADEQASEAAKEIARQRLLLLDKLQAQDNANNETSGDPLADYIKENSDPATQFAEAQVNALRSLEDGLTGILMGTKSVKEAFHDMAMSIVEDLIRIIIKQMIVKTLMAAMGGGFAEGGLVGGGSSSLMGSGGVYGNPTSQFATGGFVSGPGGPTADMIPAMLSNGEFVVNAKATKAFLPLLKSINEGGGKFAIGGLVTPRSNMSERVSISNDNEGRRGSIQQNFDLRGAVVTEQLYRDMQAMSAEAADRGATMGVQRMRDMNDRTFGRALGR